MSKRPLEDFCTRLGWDSLDQSYLRKLVGIARDEDMGGAGLCAAMRPDKARDVSTDLMPDARARAVLNARRDLCCCGLGLIPVALELYGGGVNFTPHAQDGQKLAKGEPMGTFEGSVGTILRAERVMLNFLQKLCGVATLTTRYSAALDGSATRLLDTRKTTPAFRALEKYAVACGGGWNHRMGLFDRVMLKDNHLAASGSREGDALLHAVRRALATYPELVVQVEVDSLEQIPPVVEAGAHILLLDNFTTDMLREAVTMIGERARTEASGGITIETLPEIGTVGVDFASTGALTHASTWIDIGLDWL